MRWTPGTWACIQMQFTRFGSTDASIETWFQKERDAAATKVMEFHHVDLSDIELGEPSLSTMYYDNYWNGWQGAPGECPGAQESGSCGDGSSACNANACTYAANVARAHRYEDNLVITRGVAVPCAIVMAELTGAPAPSDARTQPSDAGPSTGDGGSPGPAAGMPVEGQCCVGCGAVVDGGVHRYVDGLKAEDAVHIPVSRQRSFGSGSFGAKSISAA